ncbi:RNA-guided endonuclease TnpB family protein [Ligilactobacillus salivarius]|uniref:RNA-guided endonuclease TnpB family protein n=1 Tax=Ligilactobacillus salivarius TaxID=1624 RepID=UPI000BAF6921|nr:RNA-guided endonuclease TnpB family protein [Ligilactobacillus salivarius]PAY53425.1 transposase [Ligilactobacillus salivarius]
MEMQVTIKTKLKISNSEIAWSFSKTMEQYRQACNYVSEYIFNNDFDMKQSRLNKELYTKLRNLFSLKSQMAQSVIRTVIARYKTVKTQMARRPYKYQDQNTGEWYREVRDLTWLHKPISFNRPQVDLQRNRDWSYLSSGQLSINTLDGRVKVDPICRGFNQYLDGTWKFGLAKLLKSSGKWYLHISATKEVADFNKQTVKHVVGLDRGLRFLATSYDEQGKTAFFDGQAIMRKRAKYQKLRATLQAKGTKSAKRRLKKLSGRENRWISDQNKSWAFYQLEQFLTYKAHLNNSEVVEVSAKYTSQRCPKCGVIKKDNRNHEKHEYHCDNCGYRSNDDRIGAMNIQLLGTQYISGQEQPKFELTTNA